jgi:hypothetical protein
MLDLTEAAVAAWFSLIRPPARQNSWPPAIRPIERATAVEPLIQALGGALSEIEDHDPACLPAALAADPLRRGLQTVVAQLGAARLLRIADWITATQPAADQILTQLSRGQTSDARTIRSSMRALTARAMLTRMFSLDRVTDLQSCAEEAANPEDSI